MTHDAEERVRDLTQYTPGARILLKRDQDDLTAVLQALADTRQQLDEARGRITELDQRAVTATGRQIFAQTEADEMRQRQRTSNGLARQLADRTDELDTLRAQYGDLKDLCSEHSAELAATQVRLEDADAAVTRLGDAAADLVEKAKVFRAERDEARSLARYLRLELIDDGDPKDVDRTIREVELDLDEDDPLPGWLTDEPQPGPGPTRHGHDGAQTAQEPATAPHSTPTDTDATRHAEAPQNGATDLRTPQAWCDRYGLDIRDTDGWRGKDALSWETPITLPDFWHRFGQSTVSGITTTDYDRIIADVRAAKADGTD
jgi:hypothetical protein